DKRLERPADDIRKPKAGYPRMDYQTASHSYACHERGLEDLVDSSQEADVEEDFDAELDMARNLYFNSQLLQEIRIAGIVFNGTTFASYTGNVGTEWDNSGNPYTDVKDTVATLLANVGGALPAGIEICLAVSDTVFGHIEANSAINAKRGGGTGARAKIDDKLALQEAELARILGIDRVFRSRAQADGADVWDDEYAMLFLRHIGRSVAVPQLGRTWLWTRDCPENNLVESYRAENRRSTVVRVRQYTDEDIMNVRCGYLLGNIST
ncbi:MAG: hypothetical protein WC372_09925, partial [Candidatus Neomarinimicrobiota bacterium]